MHPLRQLHRHLEEPVGGIRRTLPIRSIRQIRLAADRIATHHAIRVQVRRPCDVRNAAHKLNPRRENQQIESINPNFTLATALRACLCFNRVPF